jgi:hypothetical protein
MEVVVRQTSGLGNQLFQYAAGLCLAGRLGARLRVAEELPRHTLKNGHTRLCLLSKFSISAPLTRLSSHDRLILSTRPELALLSGFARCVSRAQVIRQRPGLEALSIFPDFAVSADRRLIYLVGYWQSHALVNEAALALRKEFSLTGALSTRSSELAARIAAARNPVSVHIRRGDYAKVFGPGSLLSMSYYERALALIRERLEDITLIVFSDDQNFAASWARSQPDASVISHNSAHFAHEDLQLMALCHHHVMANSTFSWWGAWLNGRQDKIVVAPSDWLGVKTTNTTLVDPLWTLVDA